MYINFYLSLIIYLYIIYLFEQKFIILTWFLTYGHCFYTTQVETRGEGVSAAVLEAAKADRELKRSLPRTAAVMATSDR